MTTIFKQLQKLEPVAFGGFSELFVLGGNAVKLIEDQDYLGTLEESYRQNLAAEAGLAPRVHAVAKQDEKVVVVMDMIDDTKWFHPDAMDDHAPTLLGELDERQMFIGLKLYCKLLKAGVLHADYHSGNWFLNDADEAIAIDFGIASELNRAGELTSSAPFSSCFPLSANSATTSSSTTFSPPGLLDLTPLVKS